MRHFVELSGKVRVFVYRRAQARHELLPHELLLPLPLLLHEIIKRAIRSVISFAFQLVGKGAVPSVVSEYESTSYLIAVKFVLLCGR